MMVTACNNTPSAERENPLLAEWNTPYGVPPFEEILVEDYMPAFEAAMEQHKAEIEAIVANPEEPTFENTILALDNAGAKLNDVANTFFLIAAADTNPEMQKVEAEVSPLLAAHSDEIMMNPELFQRVKKVYLGRKKAGLDRMQLRLTEKSYKDFERNGANLSEEGQAELAEINRQLSAATVQYSQNLLAATADYQLLLTTEQLGGLPNSIKNAAKQAATEAGHNGKYLFTLSSPSIFPFLTYSTERDLRKEIYTAYTERCNGGEYDNTEVIRTIISLRARRAQLLGYKSHADYVLDDVMAKSPKAVYDLLGDLWEPALKSAKNEMGDMTVIKKRETKSSEFAAWDWWYFAERLRKQRYNLDEQALRPYFSLDNVRQGIFGLCNRLYGITFSPVNVVAYNKECSTYKVEDVDGTLLGVVIFDFFPRAGKSGGAWCGEFVSMSMEDGKRVPPVVTVVCNFSRPNGNTPSMLTIDETETFFHEFGHALHNLFAEVPYKGLAGVERDFVELPSQIMENWAMEPAMLKTYAIHHQTGAVISDHLIARIQKSAHFNQGFMTTELIAASLSDLDIHTLTSVEEDFDVNAFEKRVLTEERGLIDQIAPRYRYPYFSHIFDGGYSSGYYSYLWAEVLDKDAYQAFVESGDLFDRETAARFRKLLAAGGTKDGMELYREFRGAEPSREPLMLARGLITPEELEAQKAEKEDEKVTTEAIQKVKGAKIEGKRHRALPKKPIKK
ncbi:MAG: M3 family metallopeptidase [Tidjanibacter sp.]|nr:M3 family metallopeptidase [Tidjanibacter sp.]